MDTFDKISRERSLRKLEIASRTRHESEKLHAYRVAQRKAVYADSLTLKYFEDKEVSESILTRRKRWEQRLAFSPLSGRELSARGVVSPVCNSVTLSELSDMKDLYSLLQSRMLHGVDLSKLRRLMRDLKVHDKQLRGMMDVTFG